VTPVQIDRRPLGLNACVPSRGTDRHQYARRTCLVRRCVNWLLMVEFSLRAATAASYCLRRDKQLDPSLESGDISEYASIAAIFSSCWSESDSAGIPARCSERSRNRPRGINKGWAFAIGNTETRWLSRLWNDWRSALLLVKPETVIA
jgi:hypothetical protein